MNKKRFLWFLLAAAVFVAAGYAGVRSARAARENSAAYASQMMEQFSSLLETKSENPAPEGPYVARVNVEGAIMSQVSASSLSSPGYDHQALLDYVDRLIADENNVGMLLFIDSPGGEMKASDDLYLKLMDYKTLTGRPIYCYFDGTACSGGYYVAMASDRICANRNCICVNIGVYISTYNMTGLFEKLGVEQIAFKSSENKGIGMSGLPWTEEQKAIYQSLVDADYDQFLQVVADGRHMTKDQVRQKDDGREMNAAQALEAGFIDGIARYDEFEAEVLKDLGTEVIWDGVETSADLMSLFRYFSSALPRSDTQALLEFAESHSGFTVMAYGG